MQHHTIMPVKLVPVSTPNFEKEVVIPVKKVQAKRIEAERIATEQRIAHEKAVEAAKAAEKARLDAEAAAQAQAAQKALEQPVAPPVESAGTGGVVEQAPPPAAKPVTGNTYPVGQCTYWVKQKKPQLGNYWGNANVWPSSARAAGYTTGSTPQVGAAAVATTGNHVAYVEQVRGGEIYISEMNFYDGKGGGLNRTSYRWADAAHFTYIY